MQGFQATAVAGACPNILKEVKSEQFIVADFKLNNGQHMENLNLHVITLGQPKLDAQGEIKNAIMLFHATINDARSFLKPAFAPLFQPNGLFDLEKFYIIIPDGIGAGLSSKPSDGLLGTFPKYGYLDQIAAAKTILNLLQVNHLKLVLGTSMGGMLTWLWGEIHPNSVDALIPIVAMPLPVCGLNFIWREIILNAIRHDPLWNNGIYSNDAKPYVWRNTVGPLKAIMLETAAMLQGKEKNRKASIEKYDELVSSMEHEDPCDLYYIFQSAYDYDPAPKLKDIQAEVFAINFADDLINPPEMIQLPQKKNMNHIVLPGGYGHLGLEHPELWIDSVKQFLESLPNWP